MPWPIIERCTVQKYGMTVPGVAVVGMVMVRLPSPEGPVSNATPLTAPAR